MWREGTSIARRIRSLSRPVYHGMEPVWRETGQETSGSGFGEMVKHSVRNMLGFHVGVHRFSIKCLTTRLHPVLETCMIVVCRSSHLSLKVCRTQPPGLQVRETCPQVVVEGYRDRCCASFSPSMHVETFFRQASYFVFIGDKQICSSDPLQVRLV